MKIWKDYELTVNGLVQHVRYNQETVEKLFVPLLERLSEKYWDQNRRIILFLVAPPATGKSTLTLFFEKLSRANDNLVPVQAVGMDGFHYHADFIRITLSLATGRTCRCQQLKVVQRLSTLTKSARNFRHCVKERRISRFTIERYMTL